jgi:uncharacterized protein YyaL (SSP411 family)
VRRGRRRCYAGDVEKAGPPNRLARESSPYLLQHARNPVDWYPWGEEAFDRARREDLPVFLSVGYATCHWCHVMERESFEDPSIAELLNRDFVSIKVDREERPDVDHVYMTACQMLTRSGGWPLTVVLTPDGLPFFAGTYFPPDDRWNRPGMRSLLPRLAEIWRARRAEVEEQARSLGEAVRQSVRRPPQGGNETIGADFGDVVRAELARRFDPAQGGFSGPPKFPPHSDLRFLVDECRDGRREGAERLLRTTLDRMQAGGIFDHVGGGFHRYSVDGEWRIPHFEKMLYDNAQLLRVYAGAAAIFGDPAYRETAERIVEWLDRDMTTPGGAFASARDADSDGREGEYYLWAASEIDLALGPGEAPLYRAAFEILDGGNTPPFFEEGEGRNLPYRAAGDEALGARFRLAGGDVRRHLRAANRKLETVRSARPAPIRDDKVVTSWNALAASALAGAARDLEAPEYLRLAERIAGFLLERHMEGGRVRRVSRGGDAKIEGFLEDYAYLALALLDLADSGSELPGLRERARQIARTIIEDFADREDGGFFQTAARGPRGLLDSSREFLDQTTPSPNSAAIEALERLARISPDAAFEQAARSARAAAAPYARAFPSASASLAAISRRTPQRSFPPSAAPSRRTAGPVEVALFGPDSPVEPGARARLVVRLETERGWHVAAPSAAPDQASFRLEPISPRGWSWSSPEYPAGRDFQAGMVYTGRIEVPVEVRVPADAPPGNSTVLVRVAFQACDDRRCLAPVEVELAAEIPIGEN